MSAKNLGLKSEGGLYMLVSQAVYAYEHFMDKEISKEIIDEIYSEIVNEKSNIVLIGMPSSGKTTVGKLLASKTGKVFIDTDEEIVKSYGDIPTLFKEKGEAYFRDVEAKTVEDVSKLNGMIIATGGGAILRESNVQALKQNGKLCFIDRDPELLLPTSDRPLASDREAVMKRYNERYEIYCKSADCQINGNGTPSEVADLILKEYLK